jgi:ABC-type antimicrobial peptide transport system permease subunit
MMPVFALASVPSAYAFPTRALVYTAFTSLSSGVVAASLPARQAAGLVIVEALRYE